MNSINRDALEGSIPTDVMPWLKPFVLMWVTSQSSESSSAHQSVVPKPIPPIVAPQAAASSSPRQPVAVANPREDVRPPKGAVPEVNDIPVQEILAPIAIIYNGQPFALVDKKMRNTKDDLFRLKQELENFVRRKKAIPLHILVEVRLTIGGVDITDPNQILAAGIRNTNLMRAEITVR